MISIKTPTLVVDLSKVERNIKRMADKFKQNNILFRPHFKTHQSHFIANMFRTEGINKCTVSSVGMARYFAEDGWDDITIAFPANVLEAIEMNHLAQQIQLSILVDSVEKVRILADKISARIDLFVEIDTGYFRSGILIQKLKEIKNIIQEIERVPQFSFVGFLSHTGNTYTQNSPLEIISLFDISRKKLLELKHHFLNDYPQLILSMGDTPASSLSIEFEGIDEIRPGNFVFFDSMQYLLGSCKLEDIAVVVYCPVVAKYPERNQVVIYAGGVHLSKEKTLWNGREVYGFVSIPSQNNFGQILENSYIESLSQEHGMVRIQTPALEKIKLGDIVAVYPIHSCMTVDLNKEFISLEGKCISKYRTY